MGSIGIFVQNGTSEKECFAFDLDDFTQLQMSDKNCCQGQMLLQDADISVGVLLAQLVFLCYCFLGVALGADVFMQSIEVITSKEKMHQTTDDKGVTKVFHTRVWNATVANLTLMALGSSAPEILLNVVEVFGNGMQSGPLGPSTIVGSAAFNLMIITACCIMALSDGETRTIKQMYVFITTASYSVWAYVWLMIIVLFWTPQVITVAEGCLTMLFFVLLVANAYYADKYLDTPPTWSKATGNKSADAKAAMQQAGLGKDATPEQIAAALKEYNEPPKSKAYYRRKAMEEKMHKKGHGASGSKVSPGYEEAEMGGTAAAAKTAGDTADNGHQAPPSSEADGSKPCPGMLTFANHVEKITESGGSISIKVNRMGGSSGKVSISFTTKDQTATAGKDYDKLEGELEWADGDMEPKIIGPIVIHDDDEFEKDEHFTVVLSDPTGGAAFDSTTDGGDENEVCTVLILNDDDKAQKLSMAMRLLKFDSDVLDVASADYSASVREVFTMPEDADTQGKVLHVLTIPWQIMFKVLTPPAGLGGGWFCFNIALFWIGFQVVLISDFANQMGCQMYLPDTITAITFVALGTSLPDTFASMQAARQDKSADSSIGNVTGSNSVNVFLGLGLPWLLGSCYWAISGADATFAEAYGPFSYPPTSWQPGWTPPTGREWKDYAEYAKDGAFFVSKKGLGFSVLIFTVLALMTIALLMVRRKMDPPCELGGKKGTAKMHALLLCGFWLLYVTLSAMSDPQFGVFTVDI
jgi:Ca2+/Na+ antiporter